MSAHVCELRLVVDGKRVPIAKVRDLLTDKLDEFMEQLSEVPGVSASLEGEWLKKGEGARVAPIGRIRAPQGKASDMSDDPIRDVAQWLLDNDPVSADTEARLAEIEERWRNDEPWGLSDMVWCIEEIKRLRVENAALKENHPLGGIAAALL